MKTTIFTAAYDNRARMQGYFTPFIYNTLSFCNLNFITPAVLPSQISSDLVNSNNALSLIKPATLPCLQHVLNLFDESFVNYSTNPEKFERACFHRWFALNAATTCLCGSDYVCLLDTDFLLGKSPEDILNLCTKISGADVELVASWNDELPVSVSPEITIMRKSYLYDFCEFLLTTYFAPKFKPRLVSEYFELIGNGLEGGICDMRALACFSQSQPGVKFNLCNLTSAQVISNFNGFISTSEESGNDWEIAYCSNHQILTTDKASTELVGTHFQGSAKAFMSEAMRRQELNSKFCSEMSLQATRKSKMLYRRALKKIARIAR